VPGRMDYRVRVGSQPNAPVATHTPHLPISVSPAAQAYLQLQGVDRARKMWSPVGVITYEPGATLTSYMPPGTTSPEPDYGGPFRDMFAPPRDANNNPLPRLGLVAARTAESNEYKAAFLGPEIMNSFGTTTHDTKLANWQAGIVASGRKGFIKLDGKAGLCNTSQPDNAVSYMKQRIKNNPAFNLRWKPNRWSAGGDTWFCAIFNPNSTGTKDASGNPTFTVAQCITWWERFAELMADPDYPTAGYGSYPIWQLGQFQSGTGSNGSFLDPWIGHIDAVCWWGDATPSSAYLDANNTKYKGFPAYAKSLTGPAGEKFEVWFWLRVQDDRPREAKNYDSWGFETFLRSYAVCLDPNVDHVFIPTPQDFNETSIANTWGDGYSNLDLIATFVAWAEGDGTGAKGQTAFPIVRPMVYLAHRKQFLSWRGWTVEPRHNIGTTADPIWVNDPITVGGTPHDDVSALVFIDKPNSTIILNGVNKGAFEVGYYHLHSPLQYGNPTCQIIQNGAPVVDLVSPLTVTNWSTSDRTAGSIFNKKMYVVSSNPSRRGMGLPFANDD